MRPSDGFLFQAAVSRTLPLRFPASEAGWTRAEYTVEVITERQGLDRCDVVMDFRDLEAALDALLAPLRDTPLAAPDPGTPEDLAAFLIEALKPAIPAPARMGSLKIEPCGFS